MPKMVGVASADAPIDARDSATRMLDCAQAAAMWKAAVSSQQIAPTAGKCGLTKDGSDISIALQAMLPMIDQSRMKAA